MSPRTRTLATTAVLLLLLVLAGALTASLWVASRTSALTVSFHDDGGI